MFPAMLAQPPLLRLIRPRQWVKNAFVAAPLFFTPQAVNAAGIGRTAAAVAAFCAASSAMYILNDWRDREADRLHPEKRNRPLAAGTVSPQAAGVTFAALLAIALGLAAMLPLGFAGFLAAYVMINLAYSFGLKHVSLLDVLVISVGFVLRVEAGAAAIEVTPTVWILVCTFLLSMFLALAKRRDDIVRHLDGSHRASLKGYNARFIDQSLGMVLGALFVSYMIYTTDYEVTRRFGTQQLYLTAPFVAAGVLRYLQITLVEERSGSPTDVVTRDPFLIATVLGWIATFAILIYG
jgi:4-hydroxybenzoate polyprenyltransferase